MELRVSLTSEKLGEGNNTLPISMMSNEYVVLLACVFNLSETS